MRPPRSRASVRRTAAALGVAVILSATGCGSKASQPQSSGGSQGSAALLGPAKAATGTPVTIGFITDGKNTSIDFTSAQRAAQAAVKYVNEHLGGVAGSPIQLSICETQQSPAKATECANQMVKQQVPVVLNDITGVGASVVPPIAAAGIPYITFSGTTAAELTTPGVYSLTGSIASLIGGLAEYSEQQKISKVAVLGLDIPAVRQALQGIGKPAFAKAGLGLEVVPVPPGTPDLTPQVGSVISSKAGGMLLFGDKNMCSAGLKAAHDLGYTGKVYIVQQCIDPTSVNSVPGGYTGVVIASVTNVQNGNPEFELYKAVLQQYSPDTAQANAKSGTAIQGYGAVVGFARAMAAMTTGDLTPATVKSALTSAPQAVLPVGGGNTFTCNGKVVASFVGYCSVATQITTLNKDGSPSTYAQVDPTPLFQ